MIYLASPYSSPEPSVVSARFMAVERTVAAMLKARIWVFSPIVHCHEIARNFGLPGDISYWTEYDEAMLRASAQLWVLQLKGWKESKGVAHEISFWKNLTGTDAKMVTEDSASWPKEPAAWPV